MKFTYTSSSFLTYENGEFFVNFQCSNCHAKQKEKARSAQINGIKKCTTCRVKVFTLLGEDELLPKLMARAKGERHIKKIRKCS